MNSSNLVSIALYDSFYLVQSSRDLFNVVLGNGYCRFELKTSMKVEESMRNVVSGKESCKKNSEVEMFTSAKNPKST